MKYFIVGTIEPDFQGGGNDFAIITDDNGKVIRRIEFHDDENSSYFWTDAHREICLKAENISEIESFANNYQPDDEYRRPFIKVREAGKNTLDMYFHVYQDECGPLWAEVGNE